jgi:nitroimidazol reductase NimA-like FMN-containing flavoprotein (pyridoxamine 5'-phosphate oxidase superfamily)
LPPGYYNICRHEDPVRKSRKEIKDGETIARVLNTCHVGRMGTIGRDGYPMVKPLNFIYDGGRIYFHTALEGEKIDDIRRDNRVCFEVDLPVAFVRGGENPCSAEYLYRSVIIKGRASMVRGRDEKILALKRLMEKYQPEGGYGEFSEEKLSITGIVRIDVLEMTGKQDLGKDGIQEEAVKALKEGAWLPIVIEGDH